jgi:MFS family permease
MKTKLMFAGLRDFFVLWSSQFVSSLGTAMTNFALIVWVYGQKGTASSMTLLSVCSFLPWILFSFIAGAIADRWDRKRIMLSADFIAAMGTVAVLVLYSTNALEIWHLYLINFLLSFMSAFQDPASYVATSLLVPKEQYVRVSGLQSLSGSVKVILAPALASVLLAFGGLRLVLILDLASFAVAFVTLLCCIKLSPIEHAAEAATESFRQSCMAGINFLRGHAALFRMILFFAFINFIAKMGGYGMMPALILSRTGGSQTALGLTEAAVGIGTLVGSILVTLMKPAKSRVKVIFLSCGLSFLLSDVTLGLTHSLIFWMAAAFAGNLPLVFLDGNFTAIMRTNVPIEMQGRVFSARDTIQFSTIPPGLFLGGVLADYVFEPFMTSGSPIASALSLLVGTGKGSGIALIFLFVGILGTVTSFLSAHNPLYRELDEGE